jgi:hypothetical protein
MTAVGAELLVVDEMIAGTQPEAASGPGMV